MTSITFKYSWTKTDALGFNVQEGNVTVPAALETHLLGEYARPQLVLFTEVHKPDARRVKLLYHLYL